jgi:crotonobetainyl-CoA:carnitine CoA-transferase CaiB-like acyl-CoA transferase
MASFMDETSLKGIRVLDLTQAMAGPMATMLLGDLGAEVIKIEPVNGDQTRKWAPPYINGMSAYFLSANRNKKSIALDLKSAEGKKILKKLIENSDIIMENFRPGTMDKMGFSYGEVSDIKRDIIYCSLSGYGQTGPGRDWPGYDLTVLANSGLMSINGEEGRPPVKFGVAIADITAGLFSDIAILSALYERSRTGKGQYIDMSMLDSNFLVLTHQAFNYFATGKNPKKLGSAHSSIAPYQVFEVSDGYIAVTVGTEKLWSKFVDVIGRKDLAEKREFETNVQRVTNREKLASELNQTFKSYKLTELIEKLMNAGIPCAPINSVGDAVENPQIKARDMVTEMDSPYGKIKMLGTPFKMSLTPGSLRLAPPQLGGNTEEILQSIGYSKEEIELLIKHSVVNNRIEVDEQTK